MIGFWIIAAVMTLAAGATILIPLWRQPAPAPISRDQINTAIFRERLAELEAEHQEGRIDDEVHRQLRAELERLLLVDVPPASHQAGRQNSLAIKLASLAALITPLLALGYYYFSAYRGEAQNWLSLQARQQEAVSRALQKPAGLTAEAQADLPGFTRVLQSRLAQHGLTDPDSLYLLGSSYLQLQRLPEALDALGRAYELAPQRPDILLAYAQAMILTRDARLSEAGVQLLHAVLQINPNHQGALMLLGLGAFNSGSYELAIQTWQHLLAMLEPNDEGARLLRDSITKAEQLLAGRQRDQTASSQQSSPLSPRIAVTVDLAPALRNRLSPRDTLFIFARAADGPAMPLAAVQQAVQHFPVQVTLDDSQAVMGSMKLSNFQQVVVSARISKTGKVTAQPGDLQGSSATLNLENGSQSVSLLIDQVLQ
jgi:cytochrome c-type biogenesis protein CcmH